MTSLNATKLVCETAPNQQPPRADNPGNRGITYILDPVATTSSNLGSTSPSASAVSSQIDRAEVLDVALSASAATVWLKGFLYPRVNSTYELSLRANTAAAKLFVSSDASVGNKQLVATSQAKGSLVLQADTYYYFEAVASKSAAAPSALLDLSVDAKLFTTSLTDADSANVLNSVQTIDVNSTIVPEAYAISLIQGFSNSPASTAPLGSVQDLLIQGQSAFTLGIYNFPTLPLAYNSEAVLVQKALNDLPFFYPNLVTVTKALSGKLGCLFRSKYT